MRGVGVLKKLHALIFLIFTILLSGCSNSVSKEEYDNLKVNFDDLFKEYKNLQENFKMLETEKEELNILYDDVTAAYEELYEKNSMKESILLGAWGKTSFGEDTIYSNINETTAQFIINIGDISYDSIEEFYKKFLDSIATLTAISTIDKTYYIFIKAVDSEGLPAIEFYIDLSGEGTKSEMMLSSKYSDIVYETLNMIN